MAIQENLKKILFSRFGKDVRKAIHDSIHDCYQDVVKRDAEVKDIRRGTDGKLYENAGEAVRAQFTALDMDKISKPTQEQNGKTPRALDGEVEWVPLGLPTEEQTNTAVTGWLNKHPEATTTVQDGSLTEQKIQSDFLKKIKKDYITPQMFGAKGDGIHDDTVPIKDALVFCENNNKLLYIPSGVYLITDSLTITKSVSIKGAAHHRDMLSSNDPYMGNSVLKFSTNIEKTFITTQEKAYDVSISFLMFTSDFYSVEISGEIASKGNPKKYYKAIPKIPNVNCLNLEKTIRGSIENCTFNGFSGIGVVTGQHKHITDCTFTNCNIAINTSNYDNLIHHCWFRFCSICIYTENNNTLFLSDSWFDQIEQTAIKNLGGGFMMISNCEFDLIEYCAIYSKYLWNSFIQARQSRCGLYYSGHEPNEVPDGEEYKACCVYTESVSKDNVFQVNIQRREIKPGYGISPSFFFHGKGLNNSMSMFKNCVLKVSVDTKKWLKAAGIRAAKTMAQTAVAVIGTGAVISAVDWQMVVSSAVVAGVVSVLTSVAGIPEVAEGK